jgi:hypothetical protein
MKACVRLAPAPEWLFFRQITRDIWYQILTSAGSNGVAEAASVNGDRKIIGPLR